MNVIRVREGVGWVEVICGSMFSGKSQELLRRLDLCRIAGQDVQVFIPARDTRPETPSVASRNGRQTPAIPIPRVQDLLPLLNPTTQVVALDEAQFFFDPESPVGDPFHLAEVCNHLADQGIRVLVAGLDCDFRGKPFPAVASVMAIAESVTKLHAICKVCGSPAHKTHRAEGGGDLFELGWDQYEARCRKHA